MARRALPARRPGPAHRTRRWADVLLIAPLDANTLAKLVLGVTDNCLTCVYRAWDPPAVVLAPAMNTLMWEHPATARHLAQIAADLCGGLRGRGADQQKTGMRGCGAGGDGGTRHDFSGAQRAATVREREANDVKTRGMMGVPAFTLSRPHRPRRRRRRRFGTGAKHKRYYFARTRAEPPPIPGPAQSHGPFR